MSGRVPLGFTLEGEPLVTRPALDAYVAALLGSVSEPAQRSRVMSAWNLSCVLRRKLGVLAAGVCPFCWLHQPDCVCASLPKPFPPVFCDAAGSCTLRHNDIKVTLVLHPREFMRASNTGRFVAHVLPRDARVVVWEPSSRDFSALRVVHAELRDATNAPLPLPRVPDLRVWEEDGDPSPRHPVLLFPSATSVPASTFIPGLFAKRARVDDDAVPPSLPPAAAPSSSAASPGLCLPSTAPRLHLLVVDGTWIQATKMAKALAPSVPCVRIDVPDHTSTLYTPLRKETVEGRTSTLEAIAGALSDLGERRVITDRMLQCVRVLTDGLLRQNGREFKSKAPRRILLGPAAGAFAPLTEALMLRIVAFLDTFTPPPGPPPAVDDVAAAPPEEEEEEDEGEEEEGSARATGVKIVVSWRSSPFRRSVPVGVRPLGFTCETFTMLLVRHAVAVGQRWR